MIKATDLAYKHIVDFRKQGSSCIHLPQSFLEFVMLPKALGSMSENINRGATATCLCGDENMLFHGKERIPSTSFFKSAESSSSAGICKVSSAQVSGNNVDFKNARYEALANYLLFLFTRLI